MNPTNRFCRGIFNSAAALCVGGVLLANNGVLTITNTGGALMLSDLKVFGSGSNMQDILLPNNATDDLPFAANGQKVFFANFRIERLYTSYMDQGNEVEVVFTNVQVCQGRPIPVGNTFPIASQGVVLVVDGPTTTSTPPAAGNILTVVNGVVLGLNGQPVPGWFAATGIDLNTGAVSGSYTGQIIINNYLEIAACTTAFSSYCTPGTSTNACNPLMHASGFPSAGQSSGFVLSCNSIEGQKSCVIFYGISGQQATPWGGGSSSFLCVKAPSQRMPVQATSGGANTCSGSASRDWLTFMSTHPNALGNPLVVGSRFEAQTWYRDPPAPKTTNFSDAIEFVLVP